jgi:prepilin-type processing-associated H-X9-DG protein
MGANSLNHDQAGQNVLYNDGHVSWFENIFCGYAGDNIFYGMIVDKKSGNPHCPEDKYDTIMLPDHGMFGTD